MAAEFVDLVYHNQNNILGLGADAAQLAASIADTPYTSVEAILNDRLIAQAEQQDPQLHRTVQSLHGSFNGGWTSLRFGPYGPVASAQGVQRESEVLELVSTAHAISPGMPVVGFEKLLTPEVESYISDHNSLFIVQPKAEHYEAIGRKVPTELLFDREGPLGSAAIRGLCLDTIHISCGLPEAYVDKIWRDAARSGLVYEGHISTNRWDLLLRADAAQQALIKESRRDYFAFLESAEKARGTRLGSMVMQLIENWKRPDNAPTEALRLVFESAPDNPFVRHQRHVRFGEHLMEFIEKNTGATVRTSS